MKTSSRLEMSSPPKEQETSGRGNLLESRPEGARREGAAMVKLFQKPEVLILSNNWRKQ